MKGSLRVVLCLLAVLAAGVSAQDFLSDTVRVTSYRFYDTPVNADRYLMRPGDVLTVTFVGAQLGALRLEVDPEGQIVHSTLGVFDMRGRTLAVARAELGAALKRLYHVDRIVISVGRPRLVGIRVSGMIEAPGLYTAYTSQRVSEIIDSAGGLSPTASRRMLSLTGGPETVPVDLDRARYRGEPDWDPAVYAGHTIVVPAKSDRIVNIVGEVVRPRELEYMPGETVGDLLLLAGGCKPSADTAAIYVIRGADEIPGLSTEVRPGDIIFVPILRSLAEDAPVTVFGAVARPGRYALEKPGTLGALIERAGGFTPEAAPTELTVFRKVPLEAMVRPGQRFAIANVVKYPSQVEPFDLQPGDSVFVPIVVGYIRVAGEVYNPGMFPYAAGKSAADYIVAAGGFLPTAERETVEILHRVSRITVEAPAGAQVHDGDEITVLRREELR